MENKLKSCPFCGGKAVLKIWIGPSIPESKVSCEKCFASSAFFIKDSEAIEAWNKRTEVKDDEKLD